MTCRCEYQFCFRCGAEYGTCSCDEADSYYGGGTDEEEEEEEDEEPDMYA